MKIKLKHAGIMELQTNDYIERWLFTGPDYEPHVVGLLKKILSKGDNVLDLGANIGYLSLIISKLVGINGIVYAFEPIPQTIAKLKCNIDLNNLGNVKVIEKAVSNKNDFANFKIPSAVVKNSGRSSLRTIEENYFEHTVQTITVDSMLWEVKKIKLIKMDIEGAEGLALEGMEKLIQRDRPIFIMELSDYFLKQLGYSAKWVLNFFKERHYKVFFIGKFDKQINSETRLTELQYDIICIPSEDQLIL